MSEFGKLSEERRRHERKKVKLTVSFGEKEPLVQTADTRDIGLGGLYVSSNVEITVGSPIRVSIEFPEGKFESEAIVVYVDEGEGFGVRFQNLSEESEKILRKALELQ